MRALEVPGAQAGTAEVLSPSLRISKRKPNSGNHMNTEKDPISEARLNANRENAQKSTGPTSSEGKAKASLNAVKCNLTGNTILFTTTAEAGRYAALVASYEKMYEPVGPEESALTQSITDIRFRLNRIPGLEQAIIALGSQKLIEIGRA